MGYRSEVAIIVQMDRPERDVKHSDKTIKDWHLFISELKANPKCEKAMKELTKEGGLIDYGGIDMKNCSLYAHFEDMKWYGSYSEVQSFQAILDIAQEYIDQTKHQFKMSACFLRVGEEVDDIERDAWGEEGYDLAYISSPTIQMDWNAFDKENKLLT
jgi:hypothetical protein